MYVMLYISAPPLFLLLLPLLLPLLLLVADIKVQQDRNLLGLRPQLKHFSAPVIIPPGWCRGHNRDLTTHFPHRQKMKYCPSPNIFRLLLLLLHHLLHLPLPPTFHCFQLVELQHPEQLLREVSQVQQMSGRVIF